MAALAWVFPDNAKLRLLDDTFDLNSDTFKMALHLSTGTQPSTSTTAWSGLSTSEHAAANGYTAGGNTVAFTLSQSGASGKIDITTDPTFTASGGNMVFKWAVIYEVGGDVLCYSQLDSGGGNITVTDGNSLTIQANATNGVALLSS